MSDSDRFSRIVAPDRLDEYADDIHYMYWDVEFYLEQLTRYGVPVIFKGAPGVGKTTSLFKVSYKKTEPTTYLAARTDMYNAAKQKALEAGFDEDEIAVVPSPFQTCPTFLGAHGNQIQTEYKHLYSMGLGAAYLHNSTSIETPCHHDTVDCPYMTQRIEDPNEYNVIIGHYKHALNETLIENRLTFVDEFAEDDAVTTFTKPGLDDHTRIGKAFDGYFDYADFLPWRSFGEFIIKLSRDDIDNLSEHAGNIDTHPDGGDTDGLIVSEQELLEMDPDERFHKKAPAIIFGLLMAEDLGNEWHSWQSSSAYASEFSELSEDLVIVRNDPNNLDHLEIYMLEPTDLGAASQVIGLDGTARKPMWDTIFKQDFAIEEFIGNDQMLKYVQDVQGMDLWKSTEAARPYSSARDLYADTDAATIQYTSLVLDDPVVITAKKAARQLEKKIPRVFEEDVRPVTIKSHRGEEERNVMNFASVRSNNEAAGTEAICILGSPHPGDDVLERWGALMGVGIQRVKGTQGTNVQYQPDVGQDIYGHFVLDKIEQSIMRGRRGDVDDTGSTVVIGTGCRPEWVDIDVELNIVEDSPFRSEGRRTLIRYLAKKGQATSTQLRDETGFSRAGLHHAMSALIDGGLVSKETQDGQPNIYTWIGPE